MKIIINYMGQECNFVCLFVIYLFIFLVRIRTHRPKKNHGSTIANINHQNKTKDLVQENMRSCYMTL